MELTFEERIRKLKQVDVSRKLIFQVLTRVTRSAPTPIARVEISRGRDLGDDFGRLSEGSVSRAVSHLISEGLLEQVESASESNGRGIALSRDRYRCIGVHVHGRHGRATALTGVLVGLAGNRIATQHVPLSGRLREQEVAAKELVDAARELVEQLIGQGGGTDSSHTILGVGVEIGGHVLAGTVVSATNENWLGVDLANMLEERLEMPVVLENDVNALAIWETHRRRFGQADMAVVAVFDEGVGGALIVGDRLYRGGGGMAGEIGHLAAEYLEQGEKQSWDPQSPTFDDRCPSPCNRYGHVDCLATPIRIRGQLGVIDFDAIALAAAIDPVTGKQTEAGAAFDRAGTALGRGLVDMVNIANPSRLLLVLPDSLVKPPPASAGAAYIRAMETALHEAFSTGARDAMAGGRHVTVRALTDIADLQDAGAGDADADPPDVVMARAAAASVLDAFLARIAGRIRPRRPGDTKPVSFDAVPASSSA